MAQYVGSREKAFQSGGTIPAHTRVKIASGVLAAAGIDDNNAIGVTRDASVSGDFVTVIMWAPSMKMRAAAGVTAGAIIFTAAAGEVSVSASTAYPCGIALETATAEDDVIEVLPVISETAVA